MREKIATSTRSTSALTIGALALDAGVNVETVRYYQRRKLLAEPAKPAGSHRRYALHDVHRIRFIKRAQQLGFTLEEVAQLLALEEGGTCRETRQLAEKKLAMIESRIASLSRMRRLLKGLIAECATGSRARACPIIATLSDDSGRRDQDPKATPSDASSRRDQDPKR